jgi:hypothetical protein
VSACVCALSGLDSEPTVRVWLCVLHGDGVFTCASLGGAERMCGLVDGARVACAARPRRWLLRLPSPPLTLCTPQAPTAPSDPLPHCPVRTTRTPRVAPSSVPCVPPPRSPLRSTPTLPWRQTPCTPPLSPLFGARPHACAAICRGDDLPCTTACIACSSGEHLNASLSICVVSSKTSALCRSQNTEITALARL